MVWKGLQRKKQPFSLTTNGLKKYNENLSRNTFCLILLNVNLRTLTSMMQIKTKRVIDVYCLFICKCV